MALRRYSSIIFAYVCRMLAVKTDIGGMGKDHAYITDTTVDNLSDKTISGASFSLYFFNKSKSRIGEGYINLTNVAAPPLTMRAGHYDERL
jgi:hypothetical protein